jgi:hypothetical protein
MSSAPRAAGAARSDAPILRVSGPADLVSAIPYLLGFHPSRSLVVVGLAGRRVVVTARMDLDDLSDPAQPHLLADTVGALARGGAASFVGVVYDDDAPVPSASVTTDIGAELPWSGVVAQLDAAAVAAGGQIDDVVLVSRARLWSYLCTVPACCPPEGQPVADCSPVAAAATYAGLVALPDRQSLADLLAPAPGADPEQLRAVLADAERAAVTSLIRGTIESEDRSVKRALFAAGRAAAAPGAAPALAEDQLARFAVALRRYAVRDAVWLAIDESRLDCEALLREMATRLPRLYDAAPLFLVGWSAYRRGDGALAGIAATRAIESDPGYSAADLLLAALSQGIDPRRLPRLRLRRSA